MYIVYIIKPKRIKLESQKKNKTRFSKNLGLGDSKNLTGVLSYCYSIMFNLARSVFLNPRFN